MYSPSISGLHQGIVVRCFLGGLSKVVALGQRTSLKRQSLSHCMTNMAACEFVYKKSFVMYCSCIHQRTLIINITMQWQHHMLFTVYIYATNIFTTTSLKLPSPKCWGETNQFCSCLHLDRFCCAQLYLFRSGDQYLSPHYQTYATVRR